MIIKKAKIEEFLRDFAEFKKIFGQWDKRQKLGFGVPLHGGGPTLENPSDLGTGDGATTTFTLPSTPYDSNALKHLFVGGSAMFETDDWTRSGTTITFLTAPPSGARISNPAYRKAT